MILTFSLLMFGVANAQKESRFEIDCKSADF